MNKLTKKISTVAGIVTIVLGIIFSFVWDETEKVMSLFFMGSLLIVMGVLPRGK